MKRRDLKKDIDYLVAEVIDDCYMTLMLHGDKHRDEVTQLMESVVDKRNDLVARVGQRHKDADSKAIKAHFASIRNDLRTTVEGAFEQLGKMSAEKA